MTERCLLLDIYNRYKAKLDKEVNSLKKRGYKWHVEIKVQTKKGDNKQYDFYTGFKPRSERELRNIIRNGKSATKFEYKIIEI